MGKSPETEVSDKGILISPLASGKTAGRREMSPFRNSGKVVIYITKTGGGQCEEIHHCQWESSPICIERSFGLTAFEFV
jgi:hypothetical protein